jgi:hypothetical protein
VTHPGDIKRFGPGFTAALLLFVFSAAFFVLRFGELGGWYWVREPFWPKGYHPAIAKKYADIAREDELKARRERMRQSPSRRIDR